MRNSSFAKVLVQNFRSLLVSELNSKNKAENKSKKSGQFRHFSPQKATKLVQIPNFRTSFWRVSNRNFGTFFETVQVSVSETQNERDRNFQKILDLHICEIRPDFKTLSILHCFNFKSFANYWFEIWFSYPEIAKEC